jgi:hypothetical protein
MSQTNNMLSENIRAQSLNPSWQTTTPLQTSEWPQRAPAPSETALYTKEMLVSLKKIAIQQNQLLLAHLLDLSALEAKTLGEAQDRDTLLPGGGLAVLPVSVQTAR